MKPLPHLRDILHIDFAVTGRNLKIQKLSHTVQQSLCSKLSLQQKTTKIIKQSKMWLRKCPDANILVPREHLRRKQSANLKIQVKISQVSTRHHQRDIANTRRLSLVKKRNQDPIVRKNSLVYSSHGTRIHQHTTKTMHQDQ